MALKWSIAQLTFVGIDDERREKQGKAEARGREPGRGGRQRGRWETTYTQVKSTYWRLD